MRKLAFAVSLMVLVLSACQPVVKTEPAVPPAMAICVVQPSAQVEVNGLKLEVKHVLVSARILDLNTGEVSEAGPGQEWILVGVAVLDGNPGLVDWSKTGTAPVLLDREGHSLSSTLRGPWVFRLGENDDGVKAALIFAFLVPKGSSGLVFRLHPGIYIDLTSLEE